MMFRFPPLASIALLACCLSLHAEDLPDPAVSTASEPTEADTAPPAARPALSERSQLDAQALERQLAASEQQQLQADGESFLVLWLAANSPQPLGAVILLPDDGQTADSPNVIGSLRRKLPDAGWHSLSLSLPDPLDTAPPARSAGPAPSPAEPDDANAAQAATETADEAPAAPPEPEPEPEQAEQDSPAESVTAPSAEDKKDAVQSHAERIFARIDAGIAYARQQQAKNIVLLGNGSGAYWASRFLAQHQATQGERLLMISARTPTGFVPPLEQLVANLELGVGDLFYKDQPGERNHALERLNASKRRQQVEYRQVGLNALPGNFAAEQEQLYRRVRGWLSPQKPSIEP